MGGLSLRDFDSLCVHQGQQLDTGNKQIINLMKIFLFFYTNSYSLVAED